MLLHVRADNVTFFELFENIEAFQILYRKLVLHMFQNLCINNRVYVIVISLANDCITTFINLYVSDFRNKLNRIVSVTM